MSFFFVQKGVLLLTSILNDGILLDSIYSFFIMYVIQNSLGTDSPIMLINRNIGYDSDDGYGVNGSDFQRELMELDGNPDYKCIQVWINSPGGNVMDGYNIYSSILKTKTPVDTYCIGIAASIAAVIFQAGRKRIMSDYGRLMYHNPFMPDGADDANTRKSLSNMQTSLVTMVASRSGKSETDISAMMNKTTWILPEDALAAGLCDSIEISGQQNVKHGNMKALWKAGNEIVNSILKIEDMAETTEQKAKVGISLIANYLGLNSEATENSVLTEVKNKINAETLAKEDALTQVSNLNKKLTTAENSLKDANEKLEAKENEITKMKNDAKLEKETADKKVKDAENSSKLEKATNMVKGHAKLGKIKNDDETVSKWVSKAFDAEKGIDDFDGVDNMLKELPVNKVANKINVDGKGADGKPLEVGMNAEALMAQVQNTLKKGKQ